MLLFLFGEDSFSSWQKLNLIKDKFLATQEKNNLVELTAVQLEGVDLQNLFNLQTLWSGHRLIILRDILAEANQELKDNLKKFLTEDYGPELTIIVWESSSFDRRQSLYKTLNIPRRAQEFKSIPTNRIPAKLLELSAEFGFKLTPEELQQLAQTVGTDLWLAYSELTKLSLCPPELRTELISPTTLSATFALQDAIVSRKPQTTWHVLHNQIARGDDSSLLVGSLAATIRNIIRINELSAKNFPLAQIAQATGIHPFVIGKLVPLAKSRPGSYWIAQYRRLSDLDWKIKTSAIESDGALELAGVSVV